MARRTRLAIISSRPVTDQERMQVASQALDDAVAEENPQATSDEILAALRTQNASLSRLVVDERSRADQTLAQLEHATAEQSKVREAAQQEISRVKQDAATFVEAATKQAQVAEKAAIAATRMQQVVGALGGLISFLVDRAPVIGTLLGGYLLSRNMLPEPSTTQLALLAIYGAVAVAPAVWLSIRRA